MPRVLAAAAVVLWATHAVLAQTVVVLHIRVALAGADQKPVPVTRHALLISDNPATSSPRRVVTGVEGTIDVRLRPGNYTVESDEPFALLGRSYAWTQTLDVPAGRDTTLELTDANAEVGAAVSGPDTTTSERPGDPLLQLSKWRDSVAGIWTPTAHASAFLVDARGLLVTNQRSIGDAAAVEVQFSPALKVEGRVVTADAERDIAVVRIDPAAAMSIEPVPLGCAQPAKTVAPGEEIVALGMSMRGLQDLVSGDVQRATSAEVVFESRLSAGRSGGPVFTAAGDLVGVTSPWSEKEGNRPRETRVVPIAAACEVLRTA